MPRIVMFANCTPCQPLPTPQLPWWKRVSEIRATSAPSIATAISSSRHASFSVCQVFAENGTLPPLSFVAAASNSHAPESATFNS